MPLTLGLTLLTLAAASWPGAGEWLQWDRQAVAEGEIWRVLTGHFVHWNNEHLFWDLIVFAIAGVWCERFSRARLLICLVAAGLLIPFTLRWALPQIETYRGLSGLDAALFTFVAVNLLREKWGSGKWPLVIVALLLGQGAKLGFEIFTGSSLFVDARQAGFQALPLAHALGAAVGAILGLAPKIRRTQFGKAT